MGRKDFSLSLPLCLFIMCSWRILYMYTVCFYHSHHPLPPFNSPRFSLTIPFQPIKLLPLFLFVIIFMPYWVQLVLLICILRWNHPLQHGYPTLPQLPPTVNTCSAGILIHCHCFVSMLMVMSLESRASLSALFSCLKSFKTVIQQTLNLLYFSRARKAQQCLFLLPNYNIPQLSPTNLANLEMSIAWLPQLIYNKNISKRNMF